ncbi:hypothetical protein [Rivularia sp. UHCC 0363]|nr:hypothetical protein [Rivularia sp. UHCC 0363]MEA5593650.1 hypothetical protein [Rivularia sp. UHCC 0363]
MAWAAKKRKVKVPDYGRPKRREIGFAQYITAREEAKKNNPDTIA